MIPDDCAFLRCTSCGLSFYLELITEMTDTPLPTNCPYCGAVGCLDDLETHLDTLDATIRAEMRRSKFSLLKGGKTQDVTDANEATEETGRRS